MSSSSTDRTLQPARHSARHVSHRGIASAVVGGARATGRALVAGRARVAGRAPATGRLFPVAAVVAAGALVAACGSGGSSSAGSAAPGAHLTRPPATTAPAATSSSGSSPASTGTSRATGPGRCRSAALTVAHAENGAAAGSLSERVTFTNTSSATCTLTGFPGMQMLDAQGKPLPTRVHRGSASSVPPVPERTVTLAPGGTASFVAGWADATGYAGDTCPTSAQVEITAPNDYSSKTIAWQITPYGGNVQHLQCGQIAVSPVYAGSGQPPS